MDGGFIEALWKYGLSAWGGVLSLIAYTFHQSLKTSHDNINKLNENLSAHKIEVAEKYSSKKELSEAKNDSNESVKRLHERIDKANDKLDAITEKVAEGFSEMKTLLISTIADKKEKK